MSLGCSLILILHHLITTASDFHTLVCVRVCDDTWKQLHSLPT